MSSLKTIIFIIATIILIFLLRKSLKNIHSHGFYRFFAFEFIIILFLMNIEFWFTSPFSFNQIISWILLISSGYFVIEGYRLLSSRGKPDKSRPDENLYKLEKTTKLVTEGIYNYVRHPLYGSLLFLAWGIFFKSFSIVGFLLAISTCLFLFLTAKIEEKENSDYFGEEYRSYLQRTKMFIPYIW
jgi:protein-S-isoprenylcysteine O-methyltransferase Ste14